MVELVSQKSVGTEFFSCSVGKESTLTDHQQHRLQIRLFFMVIFLLIIFSYKGIGQLKKANPEHPANLQNANNAQTSHSTEEIELKLLKHEVCEERNGIIFTIVTAVGFSMFLTLLFIDSRRKKKILWQHMEIAEAESKILKSKLEASDREVASKVLFQATINDTKARLSDTYHKLIPYLNEEGITILHAILKEFDFKAEHDAWDEFELHFQKTNQSFYDALLKMHPDLTGSERRMCAFIKLNLETKEIAMIQNKSSRSIESTRYRLKKKMGLGDSENLSKYLSSL